MKNHRPSSKFVIAGLLVLLGIAFFIRLWGNRFGLPYTYHYDEPFYVSGALNFGAGNTISPNNPPGFMNILLAEYGLFYVFGRLFNLFSSPAGFESLYRTDPTMFYLLGRITSAIFGGLSVLVVFGIGKKIFNQMVGLVAAALLAFSFLHVRDSHFGVPDITASFFVVLSVYLTVLAIESKKAIPLFLAGVVAGVAVTTKWSVWPVIVPVAMGIITFAKEGSARQRLVRFFGLGMLTGLLFIASFLLFGFQIVIAPLEYFKYARLELSSGAQGGFGLWQVDTLPGWLFYLKTLTYGIGWAMLLMVLLGLVWILVEAARRRQLPPWIFLAFPLLYFLVMGSTRHYFARYALPLLPFLTVCGAVAVTQITSRLTKSKPGLHTPVLISLTVVVILQPALFSLRFDQLIRRTDTRTVAKAWIEANIPEGARIAMDDWSLGPPLSTPQQPVADSSRTYQAAVPNYLGLYQGAEPSHLREQGFDYVITSNFIDDIPVVDLEKQAKRQAFYSALEHEFTLVKVFRPEGSEVEPPFIFDEIYGPAISLWARQQPGPAIKIYAVNPVNKP